MAEKIVKYYNLVLSSRPDAYLLGNGITSIEKVEAVQEEFERKYPSKRFHIVSSMFAQQTFKRKP